MNTSWLSILDELYEGSWNAELHRFRSPYAFRGASSATHTLASSLVRLAGGRADVRRLELALLRNFRKYAHGEVALPDSIWSWLALGQHRGLPTRLLDWTYSPLVALHFVTDDPSMFGHDGVVWCVNFVEANKRLPPRLRKILEEEGSDTFTAEMLGSFETLRDFEALRRDPFVVFMEPPAVDRRILNQLALFSLMSSPEARLDDWLEGHPQLCRKVRVPADMKWEIRDKLDQANINERVLFPGLDGLSRWLARYYTPTLVGPKQQRQSRRLNENADHQAEAKLRQARRASRDPSTSSGSSRATSRDETRKARGETSSPKRVESRRAKAGGASRATK